MARPTLDEIFAEPDDFGLLDVKAANMRTSNADKDAAIRQEVEAFYAKHERWPDPDAPSHDEMRLGTIWSTISPNSYQPTDQIALRDWREEPDESDIPDSLDDIFGDDGLDVDATLINLEHVTAAAERHTPDHRADFVPCRDFHLFEPRFEEVQAAKRRAKGSAGQEMGRDRTDRRRCVHP